METLLILVLSFIEFVLFDIFKKGANEILYNNQHGIEHSDKLINQTFVSGSLFLIIIIVMLVLVVKLFRKKPNKRLGRREDDN